MNLANEKWETIRDFPNYMISSESRVLNKTTLKMKSICYNKRFRFRYVRLHKDGHSINIPIYRLKAIAFIPNPLNKREVNHKYGDRIDEDINALEWATPKENMKHSFDTGLAKGQFKKGFDHQLAKLSKDDIYAIRDLRDKDKMKYTDIGKMYGITMEHAYRVAKRKLHANV